MCQYSNLAVEDISFLNTLAKCLFRRKLSFYVQMPSDVPAVV